MFFFLQLRNHVSEIGLFLFSTCFFGARFKNLSYIFDTFSFFLSFEIYINKKCKFAFVYEMVRGKGCVGVS